MKMLRTLSAAAFLALIMPMMGRADDADSAKQVASLSKQTGAALVAGDTSALDAILSDDWLGINPFGEVASKAQQAKDLKDGTTDFLSIDPSEVKVRVYGDAAVVTVATRSRSNSGDGRITILSASPSRSPSKGVSGVASPRR